ncbi:MAG TPA: hypothetical protein VFN57_09635, partial [Thermomicrobiaceae bacterium]|nr:hypothetical protein [Thermomicrobiaceae bacterium]
MCHVRGLTFVGVSVLVLVLVVGTTLVWHPTTPLHPRQSSARAVAKAHTNAGLTMVTTTVAPTVVRSPAPAGTPAAPSPAAQAGTPSRATPSALASGTPAGAAAPATSAIRTVTRQLQQGMVREPNGMRIGCGPQLLTQYLTCTAQEPAGFSLTFYLFLPRGFHDGTTYPLVLLLQGGGQRADRTSSAALNRIGAIAYPPAEAFGPGFPKPYGGDVQQRWPCFVVVPQPVNPADYVDVPAGQGSYSLAPRPNDVLRISKEIVDTLRLAYHQIDANRLYVTGFSAGGYGTWEAAERWPNYWAAAAPIA